jgi:uncharacterized protein (TIGR03086 family)
MDAPEAMDAVDALTRAGEEYRRRLVEVGPEQWSLPSACEAWTVKELADHVLGGNRFAVALLGGASADAAFSIALEGGFDGDLVGLFDESQAAQLEAFAAPGALDVEVQHPAGPTSGATFAGLRTGDLLLHGWDLARSLGLDETLDEQVAAEVWRVYEPRLSAGTGDRFGEGASGTIGADAPVVLRLLDLSGRRP